MVSNTFAYMLSDEPYYGVRCQVLTSKHATYFCGYSHLLNVMPEEQKYKS